MSIATIKTPPSEPAGPILNEKGITDDSEVSEVTHTDRPPKGLRFWLIIFSLLISTFLSALDLTAISTALPTIAKALDSRDFVWIGNAYSITATAFIPCARFLRAQVWWTRQRFRQEAILLGGLLFFAVGSAMCGAAMNMSAMLAGRAFQGVGSGVTFSLVEIVLADLVPLSERGAYQGVLGAVWALASAAGPPIGGGLAARNYRWLFYMNLPLTGAVFAMVAFCLNLKVPAGTVREKLGRMDWTGNAIFLPSITLLIMGLVWGGQPYPWDSAHVLAPIIIGAFGLVVWYFVERHFVTHPTVPFKLLTNRTTLVGYFTTLIHGIPALCGFYYWPVYFQAVKGASPIKSAVDFFSITFVVAPVAAIAGATISTTQMYKPQNIFAWVLVTVGLGVMSLIHDNSPAKLWIPLPIPLAIGIGMLYPAPIFPILAPLPPSLAAQGLAFMVFVRNFGNILGITVGSVVLTNELGKKLPEDFLVNIPGGISAAYSTIPVITTLPDPLRTDIRHAFAESIRTIWLVLIPFGVVGFLISLCMKALPLQSVTDEQWGIVNKNVDDSETSNSP